MFYQGGNKYRTSE